MKQRQRRSAPHPFASLVRSVQRLQVRHGDVLVVTIPNGSSRAMGEMQGAVHKLMVQLKATLCRPAMPVVIIPEAVRFSVVDASAFPEFNETPTQGAPDVANHHPV